LMSLPVASVFQVLEFLFGFVFFSQLRFERPIR
jgi:hypothetical protein